VTDVTVVKRLDDVTTVTTMMTTHVTATNRLTFSIDHTRSLALLAVHMKGCDEPRRRVNPGATLGVTTLSRDGGEIPLGSAVESTTVLCNADYGAS